MYTKFLSPVRSSRCPEIYKRSKWEAKAESDADGGRDDADDADDGRDDADDDAVLVLVGGIIFNLKKKKKQNAT